MGTIKQRFKITKNPLMRLKRKLLDGIKFLREEPFYIGSLALVYLVIALAIIMFVISIIFLLVTNHYGNQITEIKTQGVFNSFTSIADNSVVCKVYFNKYTFILINILISIAFIGSYIDCFINSGKFKKIGMISAAFIAVVLVAIPTVIYFYTNYIDNLYWHKKIDEKSEQVEVYRKIFMLIKDKNIQLTFGIICITTLVIILLLLYFSKEGLLIKTILLSLLTLYIGIPVVLWSVENILTLIIVLGLIVIAIFIISIFTGNGGAAIEIVISHGTKTKYNPQTDKFDVLIDGKGVTSYSKKDVQSGKVNVIYKNKEE